MLHPLVCHNSAMREARDFGNTLIIVNLEDLFTHVVRNISIMNHQLIPYLSMHIFQNLQPAERDPVLGT